MLARAVIISPVPVTFARHIVPAAPPPGKHQQKNDFKYNLISPGVDRFLRLR
jgi:hypothetical protein